MTPSRRLAGFGTTIFTEMTRLANEHGAVNLAQGFPDFDGPDFAKDAARRAVEAGLGQYAPMSGVPALQDAIVRDHRERSGVERDARTDVVVGCGATELIFAAVQAFVDVGDEVVLIEPFYDSYLASIRMAGATPRVVTLEPPHFRLDEAALRRAFTAKTRLAIVNTPHNPTGRVLSRDELAAVARACAEYDVVCLADEVYDRLVYEGEHVSLASLPGMAERTVTLGSVSKTFSFTGWRVGWATAAPPLAAALRSAHQFITFAAPTPLQHAAAAALAAPPSYYADLRATYLRRRDLLAGALARVGFDVYPAEGAYFVCAGFSRFGFDDDAEFCRHLVRDIGVAAIPPSAFHEDPRIPRSYVRFTFTKRDETLNAAIEMLQKLAR
jgi:N-succinyldiaminopimelate aminotransferase